MDNIITNKIVILIAPPRSLSTAFLRMMAVIPNFKIINEPSSCVFNRIHYPHSQIFYTEQALTSSYSKAKQKILSAAKHKHVFVKEMSFAFEEFIASEPDLINNPNIIFIFLLRDPHHCIISFYKKISHQFIDYILADLSKLTGYQSLYRIFKKIQNNAQQPPYLLNAQQLYSNTRQTIKDFCSKIKIPYQEEYLMWNHLGEQFTGADEWEENKKREFTYHWHQEAIFSNGFHQPTIYEIDANNQPTFAEIKNVTHRKKCIETYEENMLFYNLLNQALLKQIQ